MEFEHTQSIHEPGASGRKNFNVPFNTLARRGYTILEICLVLFIAALIATAAIPLTTNLLIEQRLESSVRQIKMMARIARHQALVNHQSYVIVLNQNSFQLLPGTSNHVENQREIYNLPPGETFQLKHWRENTWQIPDNTIWRFESNGLLEPMQFRFVSGEAWLELAFDPLNATAENLRSFSP